MLEQQINAALETVEALREDPSAAATPRELALVQTKLEEAQMWAERAKVLAELERGAHG